MLEQATAIENCLSQLEGPIEAIAQRTRGVRSVQIVGSGDCFFIGPAAAEAFSKMAGVPAAGHEAYDYFLTRPRADEHTLVILFSSSGKSLYVLKSAEVAKAAGAVTLGVANHPKTPLTDETELSLVTEATGISYSFPSKTTTSALAMMYGIAIALGRANGFLNGAEAERLSRELGEDVPAAIRRLYDTEHPKIAAAAQQFLESRCYLFVGSGPSRATAMVGAAKLTETSRRHVTASNAEEYLHLHGFGVKSPDAVIVAASNITDHRERQVVQYAAAQCARVLVVGRIDCSGYEDKVVHVAEFLGELSPLAAVIPSMVAMHLFASELARLSYVDPDAPHDVDLKKVIGMLYQGPVAGWPYEKSEES